jgi:cytochrome c peroxidase
VTVRTIGLRDQGAIEGYTQAETNVGLFRGPAIQAHESTLVSDDSRVDQFFGGNTGALTALELQGLNEFRNRGPQCTNCQVVGPSN